MRIVPLALFALAGCLGGRTTLDPIQGETGATGGSETGGTGGAGGVGGTGGTGGKGGGTGGGPAGTGGVAPDPCNPNRCQNGGRCIAAGESYSCACAAGWGGVNCTEDIDLCDPNPCQNGQCDGFSGQCLCFEGWTGQYCDRLVDVCDFEPCLNGGKCVSELGSWSCVCPPGFGGTYCEYEVDPCDPNPCLNFGVCENVMDRFRCTCPLGHSGERCEIKEGTDCRGNDMSVGPGACLLTSVCGKSAPDAFAGGDCSSNTAEFADWWCQLAGYSRALYYSTVASNVYDALYYDGEDAEVLSVCGQVTGPSSYGFDYDCTGVRDLVCAADPVPSTLRPQLMICGTSSRNVGTFIPGGVMMDLVSSCTPSSSTQAFLVPRSGATLLGSDLRAYLNAGGIVITEYTVSDDVWNRVFPPVSQSVALRGSCLDNVPTVVQFNPMDQFWIDNTFQQISSAETGCGYSVDAYPWLTPLTGWDEGTVALGYRNVGQGRFYAADFDWQDQDSNNAELPVLMGYMITHRR